MAGIVRKYEQLPIAAKFFGGILIVAASGYTAWEEFIVPKIANVDEKVRELEKIEGDLKALNKDFVSPGSMEEELTAANREFRKLIELLPQEPSVDRVLNDFASLARVTGTEIREFVPSSELNATSTIGQGNQFMSAQAQQAQANSNTGDSSKNAIIDLQDTNAVGLKLKMFGTFTAVVSFLDMAMALPRVVRIQDFEIINTEKDLKLTQRPKLTFTGLFHAYFQKPNAGEIVMAPIAQANKTENKKTETSKIGKPAIDLNKVINKGFSSKSLEDDK
jgi:Tfp pilus assembly protein PilO